MIREGTTADPVAGQIENKDKNYTDWKASGYFFSPKDNLVTTSVVDISESAKFRGCFASILNKEDVGRDGGNSLSISLCRKIPTIKISGKEGIIHSPAS